MQTIQDFNQKYGALIYDRTTHQLMERAHVDATTAKANPPKGNEPTIFFNKLFNLVYVSDPSAYYKKPVLTLSRLTALLENSAKHLPTTNAQELYKDFERVELYERAYTHTFERNAAKAYPATIPPPAKAARAQFVKLADLKAQTPPENGAPRWWYRPKELSHTCAAEHTLINGLIETLHDCTSITHAINHLDDLEIQYTRKDGNTGEAYLPQYNLDHYTPLFINTLNKLLSCIHD